jgi:SAM-dependent methyltransferase
VITELPLPPPELRIRVAGTEDSTWFLKSGRITLDEFESALVAVGARLSDFRRIYEFGCGCGRLTRWLEHETRETAPEIWASDIDRPAVEWVRTHLSQVTSFVNEWLPPLPLRDGFLDLVLGWSVLTHLREDYQDAWLQELARVTAPEALVLLSVHGRSHWHAWQERAPQAADAFPEIQRQLDERGFGSFRGGDFEEFPDFYWMSWHLPRYIRRHWTNWFQVVDVLEAAGLRNHPAPHDIVVLKRPLAPPKIEVGA